MPGRLEDPKVNIVLVGTFDPNAALPDKLGAAGVIREDEAAAARFRGLLPGQITDFALEWCTVTVVRERFIVETREPPLVKICDLVQKTLRDLMPHATLTLMGINRIYSIKFDSALERDALGVRLLPPSSWGNWGHKIKEKIDAANDYKHGGMTSATMREQPIPGRQGGWRDVTIAPDFTSTPASPAAIISLNDHFQVDEAELPATLKADEIAQHRTTTLMRLLAEQFDQSVNNLEAIAQDVLHG